jgi:hypothetical protein
MRKTMRMNTDAMARGGAARSSDEAPVMGVQFNAWCSRLRTNLPDHELNKQRG